MLTKNLWMAMIAGPEMEDEVWVTLQSVGKIDTEALCDLKDLYFQQMKPVVNEEHLVLLRQRYKVQPRTSPI